MCHVTKLGTSLCMQADIAKLDPITQLVKTAIMKLCAANVQT